MSAGVSWAAQQLVELLAAVTSFEDEQAATRSAVERTAEALDAQIAAVVRDGAVCASIGFPACREPAQSLWLRPPGSSRRSWCRVSEG